MSPSWSSELSLLRERERGDEGQGQPFMSVHLREHGERFWGNAVKMHTALGAEAQGENQLEEWSEPMTTAWKDL